jgi:hypothetical protein
MNVNTVITAFVSLGKKINEEIIGNDDLLRKAYYHNRWFTVENTVKSLEAIVKCYLSEEKLKHWLNVYSINIHEPKRIGIVMAGNLPLVGFHDLLCVLASGNIAVIKLSSKDKILLPEIITLLIAIQPEFKDRIIYAEMLKDIDAIIATGGNNAARYFDYYFGKYPNIIRKNRNSIAVLTGNETNEQLLALGNDVFQYYGLGCRNVSMLFFPEGYHIPKLLDVWEGKFNYLMDESSYKNNYDYNRTLLLMNRTEHLASDYVMLKEDIAIATPVSVVHYQFYKDINDVKTFISQNHNAIQCVVAESEDLSAIAFSGSQQPELWNYADDIDTMSFLISL